jgi:putative salt-induced outer membrane protein
VKITTPTASLLVLALMTAPASAQGIAGWTGEGTISGAYVTGNSQTTDVGVGIKGARQFGDWQAKGQLNVDYGKNNGIESRNRWGLAGQLNDDLTTRFYIYGRGSYEQDKFSGFDNRLFVGAGAGYKIITGGMITWAIEGGPGYRRDVIQFTGKSEGKLGARIGSAFAVKFNDAVSFSNDTEWVYSDVSTQLVNIAAVTSKLTDILAARFSFEVRNESDPPFHRKATDTATRFSLVFGF